MKRTLIALLVVTLIVAGTAFGAAYWLRCRACAPHKPDLRQALNLTPSQAAAVAELEAAYEKRLAEICAAHCAARAELAESLADRDKAAAACARMCAAQSESEQLTLDHLYRIRALLTPEQQVRHETLVRQQLTGACPMRLHRQ